MNILTTWLNVSPDHDFNIHNIPFGVVSHKGQTHISTRLGDTVIFLGEMMKNGHLQTDISPEILQSSLLNDLIAAGRKKSGELRKELISIFSDAEHTLNKDSQAMAAISASIEEVEVKMPMRVPNYTDFYSSREHATNVGIMFRGRENALMPNWLHVPVGYHGRASSVIPSGVPIHRPKGQMMPKDADAPVFGACKLLDFELEMAFITTSGKPLGESISVEEAEDYMFGMILFNDWSARDIQKWEYVPLGPFLGKNFASSISSWIIHMDALEPFRCSSPEQEVEVLDYLKYSGDKSFDIELEALIQTPDGTENRVSLSNFKYMYWNMSQQLAHHTINGCNVEAGDMMASGTISGPTEDSYGSMLELSWAGSKTIPMKDGTERKFLADHDTMIIRGKCSNGEISIGFGEVTSQVLPAK